MLYISPFVVRGSWFEVRSSKVVSMFNWGQSKEEEWETDRFVRFIPQASLQQKNDTVRPSGPTPSNREETNLQHPDPVFGKVTRDTRDIFKFLFWVRISKYARLKGCKRCGFSFLWHSRQQRSSVIITLVSYYLHEQAAVWYCNTVILLRTPHPALIHILPTPRTNENFHRSSAKHNFSISSPNTYNALLLSRDRNDRFGLLRFGIEGRQRDLRWGHPLQHRSMKLGRGRLWHQGIPELSYSLSLLRPRAEYPIVWLWFRRLWQRQQQQRYLYTEEQE